jgi:hypothetical protein
MDLKPDLALELVLNLELVLELDLKSKQFKMKCLCRKKVQN